LCEGDLVKDSSGNQVWEPTSFMSEGGTPVDRPKCTFAPGVDSNDIGKVQVTLETKGGMLTSACADPTVFGPMRNCGFTAAATMFSCTPGQATTVSCSGGTTAKPQVVRICETSRVLGGLDCAFRDALANITVEGGAATSFQVTCPVARDTAETGGQIAVYTAPVYEPDGTSTVTCTVP
jgi:hypothetical protein